MFSLSSGRSCRLYFCMLSLQVNGIDLRNATHDEAINVLRQTPQKVRLTVYRDEAQYKEEDMYDVLNIELQKKPGRGLGLSIVGKRYKCTWRANVWDSVGIFLSLFGSGAQILEA